MKNNIFLSVYSMSTSNNIVLLKIKIALSYFQPQQTAVKNSRRCLQRMFEAF